MADMEGIEETDIEGFGRDINGWKKCFYAGDGILASTRATRIQWVFDVLPELFDRVGLRTNAGKTVSMTCPPFHKIEGHSTEAYGLRLIEYGLTYQERLHQQVRCLNCDTDLAAGSLVNHRKVKHGVGRGDPIMTTHHLDVPRTYRISFPR